METIKYSRSRLREFQNQTTGLPYPERRHLALRVPAASGGRACTVTRCVLSEAVWVLCCAVLCGALLCCAVACGAKGALCGAKAVLVVHRAVHRAVHWAVHCVRVPGVMQPCMPHGGLRA